MRTGEAYTVMQEEQRHTSGGTVMQRGSLWTIRNYCWWFLADTTDVLLLPCELRRIPALAWKVSHSEAVTGAIVALRKI